MGRRLRWSLLAFAVLIAAPTAGANIIATGGFLNGLLPGPVAILYSHDNGFGSNSSAYVTANTVTDTGLALATLSDTGGTSTAQAEGHYTITPTTLSWTWTGNQILLDQTDLDPLMANGDASLQVWMLFSYEVTSATNLTFDVHFDAVSNIVAGDAASLQISACNLLLPQELGHIVFGEETCDEQLGTESYDSSYDTADFLGGSGTLSSVGFTFNDSFAGATYTPLQTMVRLSMTVKDPTTPASLALQNLSVGFSAVSVPEPDTLFLLGSGVALEVALARRRARRR